MVKNYYYTLKMLKLKNRSVTMTACRHKAYVRGFIIFVIVAAITKLAFMIRGIRNVNLTTVESVSDDSFTFAAPGNLGMFQLFPREQNPEDKISSQCGTVIACILCEDTTEAEAQKQIVARDFTRQIDQLIVLLKSIVISSKYSAAKRSSGGCTKVILISDTKEHFDSVMDIIYEQQQWSHEFLKYLRFVHYPVTYPKGTGWMKTLFRPCATLRLFLPDILPSTYSSLIYMDTDIIFLRDIKDLWQEFDKFTNETIGSMSPCLFHYGTKANNIPYYGDSGLNAGIMLMNLTRMREILWTTKIKAVTEIYQQEIKLADQDILNIYFHSFPEQLHEFSCAWNFRPWNCRVSSKCKDVQTLSALHGNALSFTGQGTEPWFYAIFQAFKGAKLDSNFTIHNHTESIRKFMENSESKRSHCFRYPMLTQTLLNRLVGQE